MATTPAINDSHDPARWWGMGEVLRLAAPSVLTTVSYMIMQFVDGWMVSKVSEEAMSAQLAGGMAAFTCVCFFIGMLSVVSTFASQYLGAGQPERAALYGWQGVWISVGAAALLAGLIPLAPQVMGLFGHEPEVRALEVPFFQIQIAGAAVVLLVQAMGAFFVGLHRPMVPFVAGVIGNVVNLGAAYVLIFGKLGLPALGLTGAALGNVTGTTVQALVIFGFFLSRRTDVEFHVRRQWRLDWPAIKEILKMGAPAGVMFVGDILMWTIFMAGVIGAFGTPALAATSILMRYWQLCFMPALGVSAAATAIVGRYCGAGQPHLAWRRAHAAFILMELYMITAGIVMWVGRDYFVGIFNEKNDPTIQVIATHTFIFLLIVQVFDGMNVAFVGALRGAGDTIWPSIVQLALAYGLGIGGSAAVAAIKPEWGADGPWIMVSGYIVFLGLLMWWRFLGGKWKKMAVVGPAQGGA
jgi:multidrug resistance protein, MATE family